MNRFYRKLPQEIINILGTSKGWLVGGCIKDILNNNIPKDYDIIINQNEWIPTYSSVQEYIVGFNSFGGLRLKIKDYSIDIWIEDLEHFILIANKFEYAYNFRKNILIKNE